MTRFTKDISLAGADMPLCVVNVQYPAGAVLYTEQFYSLAEREIAALKAQSDGYDRKAVWGENPYVKFFKRFKKTYPVMLQYESAVLKDRPFPRFNPVSEVAFVTEIVTGVLSGAHDTDCFEGNLTLYMADSKEDFEGMHGTLHTYPGDFCARDSRGIVFSLVAGTDSRTCAKEGTRNVLYPLFGTPQISAQTLTDAAEVLCRFAKVLCPDAEIQVEII
ncbi:MAG: hypothetical protein IIV99_05610 [Oscillospiraceae bacterium]|nr:hypothetical protein [Oscillospiraceae bacterium]